MKHTTLITKLLAGVIAVVLLSTLLVGCGSSAYLDDQLAYAKQKVEDFSHDERRNLALFADEVFSKANLVAMMVDGDTSEEDFAKIARNLSLDSITIADENREVIASYPEGEKGKALKEIEDKKEFLSIVKNITDKQMTDPVKDKESGAYSLLAGVKRTDGTGAVIIGLTTDEYGELCGEKLAESCGQNTLVIKGDEVLSSTMTDIITGDSLEMLNIAESDLEKDSFDHIVDGIKFLFKPAEAGNYTVICAVKA